MSKKPNIYISIVLYKNKEKALLKTINSLLHSSLEFKLFLLDNSPSKKLQKLELLDQKVEYIFIGKNIGYGSAHNISIKKSIDDGISYHLVLNPDVYFKNNVLNELYSYMDNNLDVGNILPLVRYPDNKKQYLTKLLPTPIDLLVRRFMGNTNWAKKREYKYELRFTKYSKVINAPNLSGCFMFLRTSTLMDIGLFDEDIFMYLEDIDLNRRIHKKYKTIFYPKVEIIHDYAKGSYSDSKLLMYHITSTIYYFNKWGWLFDRQRVLANMKCLNSLGFNK
jgi:GT2 family glycosyltransferase